MEALPVLALHYLMMERLRLRDTRTDPPDRRTAPSSSKWLRPMGTQRMDASGREAAVTFDAGTLKPTLLRQKKLLVTRIDWIANPNKMTTVVT